MTGTPDSGYLRILDAALDRAAEGLRTAEDLVRFVAGDAVGRERIRLVRRNLWDTVEAIPAGWLLEARTSAEDVGRATAHDTIVSGSAAEIFRRNLHRAQEGLRTIEEILRSFDPASASQVAELRFQCYDIEKDFYDELVRADRFRRFEFSLYVVTGATQSRGRDYVEVVREAIKGGAGAVQLRAKNLSKRDLLAVAKQIRAITEVTNTAFLVNDHIDVAIASGADGVHLGQEDLPLPEARKIAGPDLVIGLSTHSVEQAVEGEALGATYINVGPIFATQTKSHQDGPVGPDLIRRVKEKVRIPITCMGGINRDNVEQVVLAGADRVAVVSAVVGAANIAEAARDLVMQIEAAKAERDASSSESRGGE